MQFDEMWDDSLYQNPPQKKTKKRSSSKKSTKSKTIKVNGLTISVGGPGKTRKNNQKRPKPQNNPGTNFIADINATIKGVRSLQSQFSQKGKETEKLEKRREELKRKQKQADSELNLLSEEKKYNTTLQNLQKKREESKTYSSNLPPTKAEESCGLGCKLKTLFKKRN